MFNTINLRILRAELVRDPNLILKMDPYCVIRTSRTESRTSVAPSGGKHPVWNESFNLNVAGDHSLYIALYDQETIGKDNAIAETYINLSQIQNNNGVPLSYPLTYKGQNAGFLFLEINSGSNRNLNTNFANTNQAFVAAPMTAPNVGFVGATNMQTGCSGTQACLRNPACANNPNCLYLINQTAQQFNQQLPPARSDVAYQQNFGATGVPLAMSAPLAHPGQMQRPLTTGEKIENFAEQTKQSARNLGEKITEKFNEVTGRNSRSNSRNRNQPGYAMRPNDNLGYINTAPTAVVPNQAYGYSNNVAVDQRAYQNQSRSPVGSNRNLRNSRSPNNNGVFIDSNQRVDVFGANSGFQGQQAPVTLIDNRMDRSRERMVASGNMNLSQPNMTLPMAQPGYVQNMAQPNMTLPMAQPGYVQNVAQPNMAMPIAQVNVPMNQRSTSPLPPVNVHQSNLNMSNSSFSSDPSYRNLTGKCIIKIVKAELARDGNLIAKMDPYCMLRTKAVELRTHVAEKAGKNPIWNASFDIELVGDSAIYLGIWDRDTFTTDDIIADVTFDLRGNMKNDNFFHGWTPLYYKGNNAGRLFVELQYYPNAAGTNLPVAQGPGNTYVNVNRDQFGQAY